jgi:hypothetical protein
MVLLKAWWLGFLRVRREEEIGGGGGGDRETEMAITVFL